MTAFVNGTFAVIDKLLDELSTYPEQVDKALLIERLLLMKKFYLEIDRTLIETSKISNTSITSTTDNNIKHEA